MPAFASHLLFLRLCNTLSRIYVVVLIISEPLSLIALLFFMGACVLFCVPPVRC